MFEKDIRFDDVKIANRRHDDIVIILRHDFFIGNNKNQVVVEYLNDYGCKFFDSQISKIIEDGSGNSEVMMFSFLLSQKTKQLLYDALDQESENNLEGRDLAGIIRQISNFTVLNGSHEQVLMTVKIFHIYHEDHIERKKEVKSSYYYLILRSANLGMRIGDFRVAFFEKIGAKIAIDDMTNIYNVLSTTNELKMIIKYNNSHKEIKVAVALIEINQFYHDPILIIALIDIFVKNTRFDDFIGHFADNQLLMIFYDIDIDNVVKPLIRLHSLVLSDNYIFSKYSHQKNELVAMSYTSLIKGDDIEEVESRLKVALEKAKHKLDGIKITQAITKEE